MKCIINNYLAVYICDLLLKFSLSFKKPLTPERIINEKGYLRKPYNVLKNTNGSVVNSFNNNRKHAVLNIAIPLRIDIFNPPGDPKVLSFSNFQKRSLLYIPH